MPRSWIALTLLAVTLAVGGCADEESADKKTAASTGPETQKEDERAREGREFDKAFEQNDFERVVAKLPIGEPPLYVRQYITGDGHKLYTAVERKRFCKRPAGERKRAVASFHATADRAFRGAGVKDFEQVVTPLSENVERLPALATAGKDGASLTGLGRRC